MLAPADTEVVGGRGINVQLGCRHLASVASAPSLLRMFFVGDDLSNYNGGKENFNGFRRHRSDWPASRIIKKS